jgi:glycosyltransferase involved in cell wall biosynthesis
MPGSAFTTSLIVASHNRREQLRAMLAQLPIGSMAERAVELLLVDSASEDGTLDVMRDFCAAMPFAAQAIRVDVKGQHFAHVAGVAAARGDLLAFTDDDCHLAPDYFDVLYREFDPALYQYGGGEIVIPDPTDDPRVASTAWWRFSEPRRVIPPRSIMRAGLVQGANMFFLRSVIDRVGGWQFLLDGDADALMTILASLSGYTGVLVRGVVVQHHHGHKRGSPSVRHRLDAYARSRGAYNAFLLTRGIAVPSAVWDRSRVRRLNSAEAVRLVQLEFEGAARYLERLARELAERPAAADRPSTAASSSAAQVLPALAAGDAAAG